MSHIETVLAGIAIVVVVFVVALPLIAVVLVSVASVREESAHSLSGRAPGRAEALARRLLGYRADPAAVGAARRAAEVRFAHAHRTLPDTGHRPAGGESGAGTSGAFHRTGAGV